MKLKNTLLASGLVALSFTSVFAQDATKATKSKFLDNWSVGANAGIMLFYGDIKQYSYAPVTHDHNEFQLGYGLTLTKTLNSIFGIQGSLLNGKLSGTSRSKATNPSNLGNVYFESDVFEYTVSGVINFSNISFSGSLKQHRFNFYGVLGVGIASYKSSLYHLSNDALITQNPKGGSYKGHTRAHETVLPVGLGIKYRINNKFDIGLESTLHYTNTDDIDVVKANDDKDKYQYTDITFTYKLGEPKNSLEWVNPIEALAMKQDSLATKVNGLTSDQDKDGVSDIFDKDNNTPDGAKVYGDGTAVDSDGDGIVDVQDAEPFSGKGAKVDAKGKEFDADNDGVADARDLEPNTAPGALVNFQGRTISTVGTATNNEETSTGYLPSIYFNTNSANIQYKYYENLAAVARVLKNNPSIKLTIVGNADKVGKEEFNQKLGMKRAKAVVDNLVKVYGIDAARLTAETKGKKEPLASTENSINRRVDFEVSAK